MVVPFELLDLAVVLVEVVTQPSASHHFRPEFSSILNADDVLNAADPFSEALLHHDSVDHVTNTDQFVGSTIA